MEPGSLPEMVEIDKIFISPYNVRKTGVEVGLEELASSIEKLGLLQPLLLSKDGDRYELVVGQRRFLAIELLRRQGRLKFRQVPALVRENLSRRDKVILSLSENLERQRLGFRDAIEAVGYLYGELGSVAKVAKAMGVTPPTVYKYLALRKLPDEIKELVDKRRISQQDASRALIASHGDSKKAVEIAKQLPTLSTDQKVRLVAASEGKPGASTEFLVREATTRRKDYKVTIVLPEEFYQRLQEASRDIQLDVEATATTAVVEWLRENGYLT